MYRRNADQNIRSLQRRLTSDPGLGLHYYHARRAAHIPLDESDYYALINFELSGFEIPYDIDLELRFPHHIARIAWDQNPTIQTLYRIYKVQREAWETERLNWLASRGIEIEDPDAPIYTQIDDFEIRLELRRAARDFLVNVSDDEWAELWVQDILSRLYNTRSERGYEEPQSITNGLIQENLPGTVELVRLKYQIDGKGKALARSNGALFSLAYGRDCCYHSTYYLGGSVLTQAIGRHGQASISSWRDALNFALIEYGRHYRATVPDWFQSHEAVDEERIHIFDYISPHHPFNSERYSSEELERRGIPVNAVLSSVVNGTHLFDLIRANYSKYLPDYKRYFENLKRTRSGVKAHEEGRAGEIYNPNQQLIDSVYYKPNYSHYWQLNRLVQDRVALLDLLGIPHKSGKIPATEQGIYYFQQYQFVLYPSRKSKTGGPRGHRLHVICPITGREVATGKWGQYARYNLLK